MADNYGVNARVSIDVVGTKDLNNLNNALAKLQTGEALTAKETAALERAMKSLAAAQVNNTVATKQAAAASKALDDAYKADEAAAKAAAVATARAADSVYRFNAAVRASNSRVAAAEDKALADAKHAVAAEIKAEESALKAEKAAIDAAAAATQKYNAYVRASNARIAAQEDKDLALAKRQVAQESAAAAKALAQEERAAAAAAKAAAAGSAATRDQNVNLSSQRYALYDVARSLTVATTATLGFVAATEAVGIAFEKNFASVERTSGAVGEQLDDLRASLVDISTSMPTSFADATGIATLGAQLGIASDDLDEFTQTVSKFSATTDVTIDAAATGFGRLAQLTKLPTDQISNLGSAIYQVGLTSVATESQVLAVAQSIAVSGNLAGFSADQIIALGGALASLGVQPEAARGSIMRIFNNITAAAAEGGDALDRFAGVAKESSEQFAQEWRDNPQAAFTAFIDGLGQAGQKASGILKDLGITQIRDQRALQLLASNTDVYTKALEQSSTAFQENTALTKGYDVVADTLAAKLQVLGQTLLAIGDAASTLGPVKDAVDALQSLAESAQHFVGTPIGKVLAAVTLGVTALLGVLTGLGAGFALMTASALALKTVLSGLSATEVQTVIGMRGMVTELIALKVGQDRATAGAIAYNAALQQGVGRLAASRAGMAAAGTSARALASSFAVLGKSTVVFAAISLAIAGVTSAFHSFQEMNKTAGQRATEYFGDLGGLADAIQKDTTEAASGAQKAIRYVTSEITTSSTALAPWAQNMGTALDAQVALTGATANTTNTVKQQTVAIGENAKAWLANAIANNENFQKAFQANQQALQDAGFSLADFLNSALNEEGGGSKYLTDLAQHIMDVDAAAQLAARGGTEEFGGAVGGMTSEAKRSFDALKSLGDAAYATDGSFGEMAAKALFTGDVMGALNLSAQDGANGLEEEGAAAQDAANATDNFASSQISAINAVYALGQSLAENGNSFNIYSANGRANLTALNSTIDAVVATAGDDTAQLTAYLATIMSSLVAHGINSVNQLGAVGDRIASLMGDTGVDISQFKGLMQGTANTLNQGYASGMANVTRQTTAAAGATKDLAKEVHTLSDYVDDINTIADAAFNFRHGVDDAKDALAEFIQEMKDDAKKAKEDLKKDPVSIRDIFDAKTNKRAGLDSILSAYRDLVNAAHDAKDALRDANNAIKDSQANLSGLKADKSVLEYQLQMAIKYGDALRAQEIQAELAKNAADQAKATADLADAQEAARKAAQDQNKTLKGNSQAAVNNRNKVRGLQSEYVDYIQSLIDSGASQKEINAAVKQARKDFLAQGQALGYSSDELAAYAGVFDTYTRKQEDATKKEEKNAKAQRDSAAAKRDNKKALEDLYKKYQDYITKLVESGASEEDVQAAISKSKREFEHLGTQLGYSKDDVDDVADSFDDLRTVIQKTPTKVTIRASANLDPAKRALREWKATKTATIHAKIATPKGGFSLRGRAIPTNSSVSIDKILADYIKAQTIYANGIRSTKGNGKTKYTALQSQGGVVPNYLASGGRPTKKGYGPKGTDTIPAWLTPGEFVVTKSAVDMYGLPFMNALNNMQAPQYLSTGSRGGGGMTFPSTIMVELSPVDRALVASGKESVIVLDGKAIGRTVNANNANNTTRNNN